MNWQALWNQILAMQPGIWEICLRLACAMLVGLVIGTEREYTHRPAGMRTHILVALGACVVSITGELLFSQYNTMGAFPDPARLSAQVVTGVGFLGAGTIIREGFSVKGLTTAASLWAVACLGLAAGFGYYSLAVFGMVFIFITLTLFEWLQSKLMKHDRSHEEYILETTDISVALNVINVKVQEQQGTVQNLSATTTEKGHRVTFRASFSGRHSKKHRQHFFDALVAEPSTLSVHFSNEAVGSEL